MQKVESRIARAIYVAMGAFVLALCFFVVFFIAFFSFLVSAPVRLSPALDAIGSVLITPMGQVCMGLSFFAAALPIVANKLKY